MKSFKNALVIVALFAIGSVTAKQTGIRPGTRPAVTTPVVTLPAVTAKANSEVEAELAKIDKSLGAIKNIYSTIINDKNITSSDKIAFMKRIDATYSTINEEIQTEYDILQNKIDRLSR